MMTILTWGSIASAVLAAGGLRNRFRASACFAREMQALYN